MQQILLKKLLNLSENDIRLGIIVPVRLNDRDDDPIASYCEDSLPFIRNIFRIKVTTCWYKVVCLFACLKWHKAYGFLQRR